MSRLDDILGEAYMTMQRQADKPAAIAMIRNAFKEMPELRTSAGTRLQQLNQVIAARGRRACHVSSVLYDLLGQALAAE